MNETEGPPTPPAGEPPAPPPVAPPPPLATPPAGQASPNRGLMIVLSYLWLLALVPLLAEKDDPEVQWHAKHGLVLFGAEIVLGILFAIFFALVAAIDLGCSGCLFQWIYSLAILVLHVVCIVKGLNGQRLLIPGISPLVERF